MARRRRLLTGLSTVALAAALAAGGCGASSEADSAVAEESAAEAAVEPVEMKLGESDPAASRDAVPSDAEPMSPEDERMSYFARLMLINGQVRASEELYRGGEAGMAYEGAIYPKDKVYLELEPLFKKYEAPGFEMELEDFNRAIKKGEPEETVEQRYIEVRNAIGDSMKAASPTTPELLLAVSHVVRDAGEGYAKSVKDGEVVKPFGYQKARGVLTVAVETLGAVEGETQEAKEAVALARDLASAALEAAPGDMAPDKAKKSAATIFSAAAKIEIAALGLEKR